MDGGAFLSTLAMSVLNGLPVEVVSNYEDYLQKITKQQAQEMLKLILSQPPVVIARNYPKGKMPKRNHQKVLGQ